MKTLHLVIICILFGIYVCGCAIAGGVIALLIYEPEVKFNHNYKLILDGLERYSMYSELEIVNSTLNGIYFPSDKYYCVWVEGNNITQIEDTEKHEYCHYLIQTDYKHFCEAWI